MDQKLEMLSKVPLFAGLSSRDLAEIGRLVDEVDVREGKVLAKEGAPGHEFFVILDGTVAISKGDKHIRDLGSGETFLTRSTVTSDKTIELDGVEYPVIDVEISSASHPFYTGKQRILDSAGRVEKFNQRFKNFGGTPSS